MRRLLGHCSDGFETQASSEVASNGKSWQQLKGFFPNCYIANVLASEGEQRLLFGFSFYKVKAEAPFGVALDREVIPGSFRQRGSEDRLRTRAQKVIEITESQSQLTPNLTAHNKTNEPTGIISIPCKLPVEPRNIWILQPERACNLSKSLENSCPNLYILKVLPAKAGLLCN